ncbi:hypothetical protein AOLI_G00202580 [Acnodon oligacanthus]
MHYLTSSSLFSHCIRFIKDFYECTILSLVWLSSQKKKQDLLCPSTCFKGFPNLTASFIAWSMSSTFCVLNPPPQLCQTESKSRRRFEYPHTNFSWFLRGNIGLPFVILLFFLSVLLLKAMKLRSRSSDMTLRFSGCIRCIQAARFKD